MKIGFIRPTELRAICEKSLLLLAITIPEMEVVCLFFSNMFAFLVFVAASLYFLAYISKLFLFVVYLLIVVSY